MFHFSQTTRSIRFVCWPEDYGVIAPPVAAKTVLPDWFRKLPAVDSQQASATNNALPAMEVPRPDLPIRRPTRK
ncbi:hypothetical protein [Mesorhizobium sp. BHbdii]